MKFVLAVGMLVLSLATAPAASTVTPWVPIFKGIDEATGTNNTETGISQSVHALRVDLQDPDIRLFVTPPASNYVANQRETLLQTPREFLLEHRLQVAVNSGFFSPGSYFNPSGTPAWLEGLVLSEGRLVSAQTTTNDSRSAMLFTTNSQPTFLFLNWPATNATGVFNAVSGMYPLVSNGVNISYGYTNTSLEIHRRQPRTGFGLSEDNRYLIFVTIDGRDPNFSDGALDWETAEFLLLFGAWNGMNMDGGGSTCMVKANECGEPVDINQNSFQIAVMRPGSQRPVGCNFGVSARPLPHPIKDLTVVSAGDTATITWQTEFEGTTQVEYGLTSARGSATPLDSYPRRLHVATLYGLAQGSNYYYRAVSVAGAERYELGCQFSNITAQTTTMIFPLTKIWNYNTNNLDGVNWTARDYVETVIGTGPALLYIENNALVTPRNTLLPPQTPLRTYYFRTHFNFTGDLPSVLTFSCFIDDGAVFYLNGAEIYRLRMPAAPTVITNNTSATGSPCAGDANCPTVFTVSGNSLTNLVQGDNVLAVEVHNGTGTNDIVFGTSLSKTTPLQIVPRLNMWMEDDVATLFWNGQGLTLEQSPDLGISGTWTNVPGPITQSPFSVTNSSTMFYRLRN